MVVMVGHGSSRGWRVTWRAFMHAHGGGRTGVRLFGRLGSIPQLAPPTHPRGISHEVAPSRVCTPGPNSVAHLPNPLLRSTTTPSRATNYLRSKPRLKSTCSRDTWAFQRNYIHRLWTMGYIVSLRRLATSSNPTSSHRTIHHRAPPSRPVPLLAIFRPRRRDLRRRVRQLVHHGDVLWDRRDHRVGLTLHAFEDVHPGRRTARAEEAENEHRHHHPLPLDGRSADIDNAHVRVW